MEIRRLREAEAGRAFEVVAELRTQLDRAEFLRRVALQTQAGYELWAAFEDGGVVGAIGFRPVHTLARGPHLHVDDLVVTAARRGRGVGAALLAAAEREARSRGLTSVFLDSRTEALGFYEAAGYALHTAALVRKRLERPGRS